MFPKFLVLIGVIVEQVLVGLLQLLLSIKSDSEKF